MNPQPLNAAALVALGGVSLKTTVVVLAAALIGFTTLAIIKRLWDQWRAK